MLKTPSKQTPSDRAAFNQNDFQHDARLIQAHGISRALLLALKSIKEELQNEDSQHRGKPYSQILSQIINLQNGLKDVLSLIESVSAIDVEGSKAIKQPEMTKMTNHKTSKIYSDSEQLISESQLSEMSSQNDQMMQEFDEMIERYELQSYKLKNENEIILNLYLEQDKRACAEDSAQKLSLKSPNSCEKQLINSLLQHLSRYESIDEYVKTIEKIENERTVRQIKKAQNQGSNHQENSLKWLENLTNDYVIKMAEVLGGTGPNSDSILGTPEEINPYLESEKANRQFPETQFGYSLV